MSRYEVNKFMAFVDDLAETVEEFHADPQGYVDAWNARGRESRIPVPDGGTLSTDEGRAIANRDYGALYAMGAHPYLLLHFAVALDVIVEGLPFPDFVQRYRAQVAPHGFPSFRV